MKDCKTKLAGSFESLDQEHILFRHLEGRPSWWAVLVKDKNLRIDVRKDNYINVYFEDSCVMKIEMSDSGNLRITTHVSFTDGIEGTSINRFYNDITKAFLNEPQGVLASLKDNITKFYGNDYERPLDDTSEKYVQWAWATLWNRDILDTEFAYNLDEMLPDLRIDMVQNLYGTLRFIELKRINDNRMRCKDEQKDPEIIGQMHKYRSFIVRHRDELLSYYQTVYDIKSRLGIKVGKHRPKDIESKPHLAIVNLYSRIESRRQERIAHICNRLKNEPEITWELFSPLHRTEEKMSDLFYRVQKADQFIEKKEVENLWPAIDSEARKYFSDHDIAWWSMDGKADGPTWHKLSSQIHCLNHLFSIRNNHDAVLAMINAVRPDIGFTKVLPVPIDGDDHGYICFEFTYRNRELGLDRHQTRGKNCTSVDALIYAEDTKGFRWLIPIEWKYTEKYDGREGWHESIERYRTAALNGSNVKWSVLHRADPYYELARQEILMEKIIASKDSVLPADRFLHLFIAPEETPLWKAVARHFIPTLSDSSKFLMIDNRKLLEPVAPYCPELIEYVDTRYNYKKTF